jgi:hypothetical protein
MKKGYVLFPWRDQWNVAERIFLHHLVQVLVLDNPEDSSIIAETLELDLEL